MYGKRDLSSHTYDKETAKEIYRQVAQKYIFLLNDFVVTVKKVRQETPTRAEAFEQKI